MQSIYKRSRWLLGIGIVFVLLAFAGPPHPTAFALHPNQVDPTDCGFETQRWEEGRELTFVEKQRLFNDIITMPGIYGDDGDYVFSYLPDSTLTPAIMQALLKSMAGIESRWQQYAEGLPNQEDGQTLLGKLLPCDYGMLQINEQNGDLFALNPSLRSTTRGNIAAGATRLANVWNQGFVIGTGGTPIVNNNDPEQLINWYYAIASYNGGPKSGWANNPNCGTLLRCEGEVSYQGSRDPNAPNNTIWNWRDIDPASYPYQERVFYNLVVPRYPGNNPIRLWDVEQLGFMPVNTPVNYGIRPDDSIFLRDGRSFHPNLLLFRHRPINNNRAIEYDLPLSARVTITILDANNQIVGTPVLSDTYRAAGWHTELVTSAIEAGYSYRIRAERGNINDPVTYYVGQYRQRFLPVDAPDLTRVAAQVYLPVIDLEPPPAPEDLIRNGDFTLIEPGGIANRPRYWDIQAILTAGRDGTPAGLVSNHVGIDNDRFHLEAAPNARFEITQRVRPEYAGQYTLYFDVELQDLQPGSQLLVRVRPAEGHPDPFTPGQWQSRGTIDPSSCSNTATCSFGTTFPALTKPVIISFVATFGPTDTTSEIFLDNITLIGPE